ncbi:hypothetical protein EJ05DRAFT_505992 [Pseudovirgaria hyperparasitica]|uniref:Uncharacterized protein n=1 Tax=Pseudovirgaria hyperparasitica TaxID=470096 RepID=A0A6A6VQS9_9PEZI|nr:uncharacterized protein EJ05DRAFT_505992 [Pseudovirgaria hyperparasitica]KAF2752485.1 hypothetical protein EJ05DRAFT_505992 [Pseudovirgaria hyperparasitica]
MAPALPNRPRGLADPRRPTVYRFPEFGVPLFGKAHFYPPSRRYTGNAYWPIVAGPSAARMPPMALLSETSLEMQARGTSSSFFGEVEWEPNSRNRKAMQHVHVPARLPDSATIYPCCPFANSRRRLKRRRKFTEVPLKIEEVDAA